MIHGKGALQQGSQQIQKVLIIISVIMIHAKVHSSKARSKYKKCQGSLSIPSECLS